MAGTCPHCGETFRFELKPLVGDRVVPTCPKCKRPLDEEEGAEPMTGPLAAMAATPEETAVAQAPPPEAPPQPSIVPLPLRDRGNVAMVMVAVVLVAALASIFTDADQLSLFNRALDGERISLAEADASDNRVAVTAIIYTIAYVISAITFLLWFSRAYRNVLALGVADPRYRPRWAVAYWFIPIINLFRPVQVMNDIWRGSDPNLPNPAAGWRGSPVWGLIPGWWAMWIFGNFVANAVLRISLSSDPLSATTEELRDQAAASVFADIVDVITAVLAILVIRGVTARVEERRMRFEQAVI